MAKIVVLTQGYITVVDDLDADLVEQKWHVLVCRNGNTYAKRWGAYKPKRTLLLLHRVILERVLGRPLDSKEQVDHVDCDGLNNRRNNLRLATPLQNARNASRRKDNKSGYKGVYCRISPSGRERWTAHIRRDGKQKVIGTFDTAIDAYAAYCSAAQELYGEFARVA